MSKELANKINRFGVNPQSFMEVQKAIEQMTPQDFAIIYDKNTPAHEIPLFAALRAHTNSHILTTGLAESIIKKNPVFAAKIIDNAGYTALHHACTALPSGDAFKVANLLIPYMEKGNIVCCGSHNTTFLHLAQQFQHYMVATCIPPELISIILKNSQPGIAALIVEFLYEAIPFYDKEISLAPELADNYFRKGILLQALNKGEKAIKCYKKAIQLDPNYTEKVSEIMPVAALTTHEDAPELMKSKISELTKEITELSGKLTQLSSKLKVVEEHKSERVDEVPPYREEDAPPLPSFAPDDIALSGNTWETTFHV